MVKSLNEIEKHVFQNVVAKLLWVQLKEKLETFAGVSLNIK